MGRVAAPAAAHGTWFPVAVVQQPVLHELALAVAAAEEEEQVRPRLPLVLLALPPLHPRVGRQVPLLLLLLPLLPLMARLGRSGSVLALGSHPQAQEEVQEALQ